jgi:hypothetical protein
MECEKCKESFPSLYYYNRHINRKTPCIKEEYDQQKKDEKTCEWCCEEYSRPYTLKIHMAKCKKRPSETDELKQIIAKLNDKMDKQYEELKDMKSKISGTIINNTTNNIQQNITITPYGKEDLSYLTLKDYTRIFRKGCYSIPEILKLIHCNENKPEYMNVYIKNFKDEYMFTFDGKDWDIGEKDIILRKMIESKKYLLESKFDDVQDKLPQYAITMFKKFLERSEDNEVINNIKDEMKNMFYKNRNHVIKNVTTAHKRSSKKTIEDKKNLTETQNDDLVIINVEKKPTKKAIMNTIEQVDIMSAIVTVEKKPKKKVNALIK